MSGREIESGAALHLPRLKPAERQRRDHAAALHIADRIGAQHPQPDDETDPHAAGQRVAQDPAVRAQVDELLDAIGYTRKERT